MSFINRLKKAEEKAKEKGESKIPINKGVFSAMKYEARMKQNRKQKAENPTQAEKNKQSRKILKKMGFEKIVINNGELMSAVLDGNIMGGKEVLEYIKKKN